MKKKFAPESAVTKHFLLFFQLMTSKYLNDFLVFYLQSFLLFMSSMLNVIPTIEGQKVDASRRTDFSRGKKRLFHHIMGNKEQSNPRRK